MGYVKVQDETCAHYMDHVSDHTDSKSPIDSADPRNRDPVCGMTVDPATAKHHARFEGADYHFCSAGCKTKFESDPGRYATAGPATRPARATGTIYTCPMHPQIRQPTPGNCPICGMTLEPLVPTLDAEDTSELDDFTRRFWWTLPLTIIVFMLAMAGHRTSLLPLQAQSWVELVLATPVVLWGAWPFFLRAAQSMINRSPNMWTLIGLGVAIAYGYSVVATAAPQLFPASFVEHGRVGVYFEAAAVIASLTLLGQMLELRARSRTSLAIKALLQLAPKTARRIREDGTEEDVPLSEVQVGDRLRVRPGEKVPVDGAIVDGVSAVV